MTRYILPAAAALAGVLLGLIARRFVLGALARAVRRTVWRYDDVLVDVLRAPVVVWFSLGGLWAAVQLLRLPPAGGRVAGDALLIVAILSVTWAVARFVSRALRTAASEGALPGVSLVALVASASVYVLGALVALQTLGVSITPVVTALGVGGLAVALALQDTLGNLFAGIRILASRTLRPGDYVRLETGQEGYVQDITWSQTTIRQLPNNLVIVPNAKLAGAITTNYQLPTPAQAVPVAFTVGYGSDLARVESVALEVARATQRDVAGAVRSFEPSLRFNTIGETGVQCSVALQASCYEDRYLLAHEFIRALLARFRAEGIEIPHPERTVHLRDETAKANPGL